MNFARLIFPLTDGPLIPCGKKSWTLASKAGEINQITKKTASQLAPRATGSGLGESVVGG
jgi:hypothetical protein